MPRDAALAAPCGAVAPNVRGPDGERFLCAKSAWHRRTHSAIVGPDPHGGMMRVRWRGQGPHAGTPFPDATTFRRIP